MKEGINNPGKRDGTGPARGSYQRRKGKKGKRGGPYPGCKTAEEMIDDLVKDKKKN